MKLANLKGRATLIVDDGAVDIEEVSAGAFGPEFDGIFARWNDFVEAAGSFDRGSGKAFDDEDLGCPSTKMLGQCLYPLGGKVVALVVWLGEQDHGENS